jgi:hypothetical protein
MPPKRRTDKLPPYVYQRKHGYVLRIYTGKNEPMRSVVLCPADSPISQVWKEYEKLKADKVKSLRWLLTEYQNSDQYKKLALSTQKSRDGFIARINNFKMRNGKPFGDAELKNITSGALRKYLDKRDRDGSPVSGNRELAIISVAWNWALERDLTPLQNPCNVVKPNTETARDKYVPEDDYWKIYNHVPAHYKQAMELAYLCRMRRIEIITATKAQILEQGFDTKRTKGSRNTITEWSDRLRKAVKSPYSISSMYIVHDEKGQPISEEAFKSYWRRLKPKMEVMDIEPFNFHDLKAAGVSDTDGNDEEKMNASGHKDRKTMQKYDRKQRVVKPTK